MITQSMERVPSRQQIGEVSTEVREGVSLITTETRQFIRNAFDASSKGAFCKFDLFDKQITIEHHQNVFPCMPASLRMAQTMPSLRDARVADIGTGTGILAIAACIVGAREVIATDVNRYAVELARANFASGGLSDRCTAELADMLPSDSGKFDVIFSNPPWMRVPALMRPHMSEYMLLAVDGGADGLRMIRRLLTLVATHLKPGGKLFLAVPLWSDLQDGLVEFAEPMTSATILVEFDLLDWLPIVFKGSIPDDADCPTLKLRIASLSFGIS